jgi:predicted NBD/HSP70 family sugar kinase
MASLGAHARRYNRPPGRGFWQDDGSARRLDPKNQSIDYERKLSMISEPEMRLGIDLCGSKIELVAFDAATASALPDSIPTPRNDCRGTLDAIRGLVVQSERVLGTGGSIGIGTPESLSWASGRLPKSNSVCPRRTPGALAHVINAFDPDVIVLGSGLSNLDRLCENVLRLWPRFVSSDRVDTRLARYVHGDSSGAARHWDAPGT